MFASVLIVDDDQILLSALKTTLTSHGYQVSLATSIENGLQKISHNHFDLILLDKVFSKISGLEISQYVKNTRIETPILMISGHCDSETRIEALECGVDDFLAKPFNQKELLLKIDKLLHLYKSVPSTFLATSYFEINLDTGILTGPTWTVQLRRKEFQILTFLIQHKNCIIPKDLLVEHVWGVEETPLDSTIDVHIRRVRLQIKDKQKIILRTMYGRGYQFYDPGK